jgi:hypothetical protein
MLAQGTADQIRHNPLVREAYLGSTDSDSPDLDSLNSESLNSESSDRSPLNLGATKGVND